MGICNSSRRGMRIGRPMSSVAASPPLPAAATARMRDVPRRSPCTAGSCASSSRRSALTWASALAVILPLIFVVVQNMHQRHGGGDSIFAAPDNPVGIGDTRADAAVRVGVLPALDRIAGGRRHRCGRGRQRHAQDDPHTLGGPRAGVRGQGARGAHATPRSPYSSRPTVATVGGRRLVGLQSDHNLLGKHRVGLRRAAARVRRQRLLPDPTVRGGLHRRAAIHRHAQQHGVGGRHDRLRDPAVHRRRHTGPGRHQALPAHRTVRELARPVAHPDRLGACAALAVGVRLYAVPSLFAGYLVFLRRDVAGG